MGKYSSEILELKTEKERLVEDTKRHETEFKCERRKEYEEKTKSGGRRNKGLMDYVT